MNISTLFSDRKYVAAGLLAGALILVYSAVNFFVIGGDEFVYSLNNNITIPLVLFTTAFAFSLWRHVNIGWPNRMLWGGLLAGWTLWTVAEVLWVFYGYLYQDIPYPSLADFFWLVGYIPMWFGLHFRLREIPAQSTRAQRTIIWGASLATLVPVIIFILIPIFQTNDPSNWLESILNVLYPLVDLFLLLIVLRLFFVYGRGDYAFGWNLLAAGFVLHSIANLTFSYASQVDLYYPDFKVNLISGLLCDAPYNISYLLWFLGLYGLQISLRRYKAFGKIEEPELVPNTSVLIFLKGDDTVLETSGNVNLLSRTYGETTTLKELLGISQKDEQIILDTVKARGNITDHPVSLAKFNGGSKTGYLSGIATRSPSGEYTGSNLVLRVLVEDDYSVDECLSREQRYMVSHLRRTSNSSERDHIRQLLLGYHLAYLKQLYNLTLRTGGAPLGMAFLEHLRRVDENHQWHLQFDPDNLISDDEYQIALLRQALPVLLDDAKRFVSNLADPASVEVEMQFVSSRFSDALRRNVEYYS